MLGSPEPVLRLNIPDVRLGDEVLVRWVDVEVVLWWAVLGEEERRREKRECFCAGGGGGGGEGSRLDPNKGILVVCLFVVGVFVESR